MKYYFSKTLVGTNFLEAEKQVKEQLKTEGFGVLSEIDVKETFKKKLDTDFRKYKILGACNPHFAYQAIQCEDKLGVLLPCNVVIEELINGDIDISVVSPIASLIAVENKELEVLVIEVETKLKRVIDRLK